MVERTRDLERKLSDAMHAQLTQRFVDKRTRVLMRGLMKDALPSDVVIEPDGAVLVDGLQIGSLKAFNFPCHRIAGGRPQDASGGSGTIFGKTYDRKCRCFGQGPGTASCRWLLMERVNPLSFGVMRSWRYWQKGRDCSNRRSNMIVRSRPGCR